MAVSTDDKPKHPPRLVDVTVSGVLGRFDHPIRFPAEWEFVILHGPNGVGKTKLLEVISAFSRRDWGALLNVPFSTARFVYDTGDELALTRDFGSDPESPVLSLTLSGEGPRVGTFDSVTVTTARLRGHAEAVQGIKSFLPNLRRVAGGDRWQDMTTGDILTTSELGHRYRHALPSVLVDRLAPLVPPELEAFLRSFTVHLIETHRLGVLGRKQKRKEGADGEAPVPTVSQFATSLRNRLRQAVTDSARVAQRLDRTFPQRLLSGPGLTKLDETELRLRYRAIEDLRSQLADAALLEESDDSIALSTDPLEPWELNVLHVYLEDTEAKLATFRPLLARLQLFQRLINEHFKFKVVRLTKQRGFTFYTDRDEVLSPAALSSGEQHQLVLLYDLIFNVRPGTLVLIDEPEISLHVGWQLAFLSDLLEIAKLQDLRFMVATHSPQVINDRRDRMVALGPSDE